MAGDCVRGAVNNDSSEPWWSDASRQLKTGVLLGVEAMQPGKVTEILLYAEVQKQQQDLPIPLQSSPTLLSGDILPDPLSDSSILVKVFALPLSSDILIQARKASENATTGLAMLTTPAFLKNGQVTNSSIQKRQKMSDLFDDATQQRRKLKGGGGEGVSKAMFDADQKSGQRGAAHGLSGEPTVTVPNCARKNLTKALGAVVLPNTTKVKPIPRVVLANGRRSSLRRVESALSPRQASILSDSDSGFAQQNKAALTKMIMAGMRLHGLQQRKKRASISDKPTLSQHDSLCAGADFLNDGEDEYKLVYHQTFKAAMFSFRAHFSERLLGQDVIRDVVDRLLILFCTDPMTVTNHQDGFSQISGDVQGEKSNALNLPGGNAPIEAAIRGEWSMPPTKKRR